MSRHKKAAAYKSKSSGGNDRRRNRGNMSSSASVEFLVQARKSTAEQAQKFEFNPKFACPTGANTLFTPPPMFGPTNHVLFVAARGVPDFVMVYDTETFGLMASVLHHAVTLIFDHTKDSVGENAYSRVQVSRTNGDTCLLMLDAIARLYTTQKAKGLNRGRGRIFAHNGAGFDYSGLAKYAGIDKNTQLEEDVVFDSVKHNNPFDYEGVYHGEMELPDEKGKLTKHAITWEVEIFGDKPRITLSCGSQNAFVIEFLDSAWLMPVPLSSLGTGAAKKGETPLQYTNPVQWLKNEGFDVTLEELTPYLSQAHRFELRPDGKWEGMYVIDDGVEKRSATLQVYDQHPNNLPLSKKAYDALVHWKATLPDEALHYSKTDVVVLANALCKFWRIAEELGVPDPSSFNTAAMIGLAAMVKSSYESAMTVNHEGQVVSRFALPQDRFAMHSKGRMILLSDQQTNSIKAGGKAFTRFEDHEDFQYGGDGADLDYEADADAQERVFQYHGYISAGSKAETFVMNPWYCSRRVNQLFRLVQRGGRVEVFAPSNLPNTKVVFIDARSKYPTVMSKGVTFILVDLGEASNALLGYPDPRCFTSKSSEYIDKLCGVIREKVARVKVEDNLRALQEQQKAKREGARYEAEADLKFEDLASADTPVITTRDVVETHEFVRGRINALKLLQVRTGMFYVKLPRSRCDFHKTIGVLPQQVGNGDYDSRLIFADWVGTFEGLVTAEELVFFLSEQTEDDAAVEINLTRSLFSNILGVITFYEGKDRRPRYKGRPWSPFSHFVNKVYRHRRNAEERAEHILREIERVKVESPSSEELIEEMERDYYSAKAESQIDKLLMNAGGYGPLAQQHAPDFDFQVEMIGEAVDAVRRLAGQDPEWDGIGRNFEAIDAALKAYEGDDDQAGAEALKNPRWENIIQRLLRLKTHVLQQVNTRRTLEYKLLSRCEGEQSPKAAAAKLSKAGHDRKLALEILEVDHFPEGLVNGIDGAWAAAITRLHDLDHSIARSTKAVTNLFVDYAEAHLCSYESYGAIEPSTGRSVTRFRISLPDTTASHAIRPWAVAVTAKARVSLLLGMKAIHDVGGMQILYCDTDSIHFSVPIVEGETAEGTARRMLEKQKYINLGRNLGDWDFEPKSVRPDLAVGEHRPGKSFECRYAVYASKKVYVLADEHFNILDCRARGVPRSNARMQSAMVGYAMRISRLGDRRGISSHNLRIIDLGAPKPTQFMTRLGDTVLGAIPGLYAGFNRIYPDQYSSTPAVFDPTALPFKEGQKVTSAEVSMAFAAQVGRVQIGDIRLGDYRTRFDGMNEALQFYENNFKIAGRSITSVRKEIKAQIREMELIFKDDSEVADQIEVKMLVDGNVNPAHPNYFEGEILPF